MKRSSKNNICNDEAAIYAIQTLEEIRLFPDRYTPISDNQWLDLDSEECIKKLNKQFEKLSGLRTMSRIEVNGCTRIDIRTTIENAEKAKDQKQIEYAKRQLAIWEEVADRELTMPNTKVKKVLGWNAGRMQRGPHATWFSICYEDLLGRIMMCVWIHKWNLEGLTPDQINDSIMQGHDNIYRLDDEFTCVLPYQDSDHFTISMASVTEESGESFKVVHVLLRENINSPNVCYADFCPNETLKQMNDNVQISKKALNKIVAGNELTNDTLEHINVDTIALIYYNEWSRSFTIFTKEKNQKKNLIKVAKNLYVNQVDFVVHSGNYRAQNLSPDALKTYFSDLLDSKNMRKEYDNQDEIFSLDKLVGIVITENGWKTINAESEHILIAPWFEEEYFLYLEDLICHTFKTNKLFNNYESDLIDCWKDIIDDYLGKTTEVTKLDSMDNLDFDDMLTYVTSKNGSVKFAVRTKGKIKLYKLKNNSIRMFMNFLKIDVKKKSIDNSRVFWRNYRDKSGRRIAISLGECENYIFHPLRIRRKIFELKLQQFYDQNPGIIISIIMTCKNSFFAD